MKNILIAIPTNKNIEVDTFKSIYDLIIPEGYKVTFQYFYGYNIDQIRNLIVDYTIKNNFDYLLCVDSDIVLSAGALDELIKTDVGIVGGIYRQRKLEEIIPEVYLTTENGGSRNATLEEYRNMGYLTEVDSIGFGCVLIKREVLTAMSYPHFYYQNAIDFNSVVSEDTYFCRKAKEAGYPTYASKRFMLGHVGSFMLTL